MKIIVPPESYKAITSKYPHLAEQFEPYQHISERDQSVLTAQPGSPPQNNPQPNFPYRPLRGKMEP